MQRLLMCYALLLPHLVMGEAAHPIDSQQLFRSGVDLITVDVTVVDKDGRPVRGLTTDDFEVKLEGSKQIVRTVDFLDFDAPSDYRAKESVSPERTTPAQGLGARPVVNSSRLFVILVDDLSFRPGRERPLIYAAEKMIEALDTDDLVGVLTSSGLGPVVNPTIDRSAVKHALASKEIMGRYDDGGGPFYIGIHETLSARSGLRGLDGGPETRECSDSPMGRNCSVMVMGALKRLVAETLRRTESQMKAYASAISAMRPGTAPKTLVVLSNGTVPGIDNGLAKQLDAIAAAAAEAGITFYALTEYEDGLSLDDQGQQKALLRRRARIEEGKLLFSGIQSVAAAAGGDAFRVIGQPGRFFDRVLSETSAIYRLGVELPALRDNERYLDAKVSVRRSGLIVRAQRRVVQK